MKTLEELEADRKRILKELCVNEEALYAARRRRADEKLGVKPGAVVRGRDGVEYKVTEVDVKNWWRDAPWVYGVARRKDGSWSKAVRHIYEWTLVRKADEECPLLEEARDGEEEKTR